MASKIKQFSLTKNDSQTIGFVMACLFSSAITKAEFGQWIISVIDRMDAESIPPYIFDLVDFDGRLTELYKIIGFVPSWKRTDNEDNALYGISVMRGIDVYDMPISQQESLNLLKKNPHILDSFRETFPFISI